VLVARQARRVLRVDEDDVNAVRNDPVDGVFDRRGEGIEVNPRQSVVGPDLPNDEVRLDFGDGGLHPLRGGRGHLPGDAAVDDLDLDPGKKPLQLAFEADRVARQGRRGADPGGGRGADRQHLDGPLLLEGALHGLQGRQRVELRTWDAAFRGQASIHGLGGRRRNRGGGRAVGRLRPDALCGDRKGQADTETLGERKRHSTNHAVKIIHDKPEHKTTTSTTKPPPHTNLANWAARLAREATEKTASEFRPKPENCRAIHPSRGAIHS
jgi:hypothetical protein